MNQEGDAAESQVNGALAIIYSPGASNEQRKAAQQFLDSLKAAPSSLPLALNLAHPSRASSTIPEARHFALSLIEDSVRSQWAAGKYSDEEKAAIRTYVEELVEATASGAVGDEQGGRAFIREKVAKLAAEVAKACWPQEWTTLNSRLLAMYQRSTIPAEELSLSIVRILAEDLFLFDDSAATLRKKLLLPALQAIVLPATIIGENDQSDFAEAARLMGMGTDTGGEYSSWLSRVAANAVVWAQRYEAAHISGGVMPPTAMPNVAGQVTAKDCERMVEAHLQTLAAMVEWVVAKGLGEGKVVYRLLELMASSSAKIRTASTDTLLPLFSRHTSSSADDPLRQIIVSPVFSEGGLDLLIASYARSHGCTSNEFDDLRRAQAECTLPENVYASVKGLVQAALILTEEHICYKKATGVPENFDKFVKFATLLVEHPSLQIMVTGFLLWNTLLRHEVTCQTLEVVSALSSLLDTAASRIVFVDHLLQTPSTSLESYYLDLDTTSSQEIRKLAAPARSRLLETARAVSGIKPLHTCLWVSKRITDRVQAASERDKSWLYMLQAETAIFEMAVRHAGKTDDDSINKQYTEELCELMTLLLSYQPATPRVVRLTLSVLGTIPEVNLVPSGLVLTLVEKLFGYSVYVFGEEPNIPGTSRGVEARELRNSAMGWLVKLGTAMPDTFMGFYEQIAEQIGKIFQGGMLTDMEKTSMIDFALCIIYFSASPFERKQELFNTVVEPYLSDWSSAGFATVLATPSSFLQFIGCSRVSEAITALGGKLDVAYASALDPAVVAGLRSVEFTRRKLHYLAQAFFMFFKRTIEVHRKTKSDDPNVTNLWLPHLSKIVSPALSLVRVIHQIWDSAHWSQYTPELRTAVLSIGENERRLILGLPVKTGSTSDAATQTMSVYLSTFRSVLTNVREAMYHILDILSFCGQELYGRPDFRSALVPSLFPSVSHMEDRHWRALSIQVLRPVIINCPSESFGAILDPMLPPLFDFLGGKLDRDWKGMLERGIQGAAEAQDDNESMDGGDGAAEEADFSDEIVNEKMLRTLTRSFADTLMLLFELKKPDPNAIQEAKNAETKGKRAAANVIVPEFLHKDLAEYILTHHVIRRPLLASVLVVITQPDSFAAKTGVKLGMRLNAFLANHQEFHEYLGKELFSALLKALHDPYHTEMQSEIVTALAEVYSALRPVSNIPREILMTLPQMDEQLVQEFDKIFISKVVVREQVSIMKGFLAKITGVSISQWYRREPVAQKNAFIRAISANGSANGATNGALKTSVEETKNGADGVLELGTLFE